MVRFAESGVVVAGVVVIENVVLPPGIMVTGVVIPDRAQAVPDSATELIVRSSAPLFSTLTVLVVVLPTRGATILTVALSL